MSEEETKATAKTTTKATRKRRKTRKKKRTKATTKATRKTTAKYETNELPKKCPTCHSTKSVVQNTKSLDLPKRTLRYRKCTECDQRFRTISIEE